MRSTSKRYGNADRLPVDGERSAEAPLEGVDVDADRLEELQGLTKAEIFPLALNAGIPQASKRGKDDLAIEIARFEAQSGEQVSAVQEGGEQVAEDQEKAESSDEADQSSGSTKSSKK